MEPAKHRSRRVAWPVAACAAAFVAVAVAAFARTAGPRDEWTVESPRGALTATVSVRAGAYTLTVQRRGAGRVLRTALGRAGDRGRRVRTSELDEAYDTPAGKRRHHVLSARRLRMSFAGGRGFDVLVADD